MDLINISYQTLSILIPALCIVAIELLRRKLGLEKLKRVQAELDTKKELATLAVKYVEQAYSDLHGPEKYKQAANWLADRSLERGISITMDEIQGLIESAIRMAKDEFGEHWGRT